MRTITYHSLLEVVKRLGQALQRCLEREAADVHCGLLDVSPHAGAVSVQGGLVGLHGVGLLVIGRWGQHRHWLTCGIEVEFS